MAVIRKGNPYTHYEEKRESKTRSRGEDCSWCGQKPKTLFKYNNTRGWFCNKGCWRDYHG